MDQEMRDEQDEVDENWKAVRQDAIVRRLDHNFLCDLREAIEADGGCSYIPRRGLFRLPDLG